MELVAGEDGSNGREGAQHEDADSGQPINRRTRADRATRRGRRNGTTTTTRSMMFERTNGPLIGAR